MNLPKGFLGTKADILMDIVLIGMIITPFLMLYIFRLARDKKFKLHKLLHLILLTVLLITVVLFEIDVRLSGGSLSFFGQGSYANSLWALLFLNFHIIVAMMSFVAWVWLVVVSAKTFGKSLPGKFSRQHKTYGYRIFWGVCVTSITGIGLYLMAFVL